MRNLITMLFNRRKATRHPKVSVPIHSIYNIINRMKKYRIYDFNIDIGTIDICRTEWDEKYIRLKNTNDVDINTSFIINNFIKKNRKQINAKYTITCNGTFTSMCIISFDVHMDIDGTSSLYDELLIKCVHTYVVGLLKNMDVRNYTTTKELIPETYEEFKDISKYTYPGVSRYK